MKSAYIALIIAALVVSSQMILDLTSDRLSARPPVASAAETRRSSASQTPNRNSDYQFDPAIQARVDEVLRSESGQGELTDNTAPEDPTTATPSPETPSAEPFAVLRPQETASTTLDSPNSASAALVGNSASANSTLTNASSGNAVTTELNTTGHNSQPAEVTAGDPSEQPPEPVDGIRQQTPLHPQMLTPGNFVYLGGFRPPFGDGMESRFGLGGWELAYRADGDPNGPEDGHPGSLFIVGHRHHQLVAEISIPQPRISPNRNIDELPVATVLQPFFDITYGIRSYLTNGSSEPFEIGGMQVVGDRLHWTLYKYYNVSGEDYLSHGLSSVNFTRSFVRGLWHLGPQGSGDPRWHSYKHAGYITDIPATIADRYLGGRRLMSGLQISTGRQTSSQGPALFAYRIDNEDLPTGRSLDTVPLLWYPMSSPMPQHHPADSWQGAAWLTMEDKQAVIVIGRKALGAVHYGLPRPGECYDYKGYHGSSYEVQMLFYSPAQLLANAGQPRAAIPPWYRWDANTPGGSLDRFMYQDCGKEIGGMAYDRRRGLLYIAEVEAALSRVNEWEELPVVHVLKIIL